MKLRSKLFAMVGAGALVLGIAGTAFASSGQANWTGNGVTDGQLDSEQCDSSNTPYLYWVLTPGGTDISGAELFVNGNDMGAGEQAGGGAYKWTTDFFTLGSLTAYATFTYSGDLGNVNLVISHGCPAEESSTTSFTSSEESSSTSETSTESSSTSFTDSVSDSSSSVLPSEPNTATIGTTGSSGPSNGIWMLIAGLGVVGGSVLVLMPSRAKGKR